ncbi:MAG: Bacterial toxin ue of phage lysozyme, C-term, partial [Bacteroidota bacterium]
MATINWSREAAAILDDSALFEDVKSITDANDLFLIQTTCFYKMKEETFYKVATNLKNGVIKDIYYEEDGEQIVVKDVRKIRFSGLNKSLKELGIADIVEQLKKINNNPSATVRAGMIIKVGNIEVDAIEAVAPSKPIFADEKNNKISGDKEKEDKEKEKEVKKKRKVKIKKGRLTKIAENNIDARYIARAEVPGNNSGVTIGFGFDLSEQSDDIDWACSSMQEAGLSVEQIRILKKAIDINLKGSNATAFLEEVDEGTQVKNIEIIGDITQDMADILFEKNYDWYLNNRVKIKMTNASESYNTENKTVLTSSQWLNLDDTVKELLIDMDYYGILGGKKLVTSSGETIITGIVDAVSDSGKLRDLETTLSNLNALFDEGNIVTQIRD